jgi:predicted RNA binding protein YcfA (HicA-like mRNA interferase family)
MPKISGIGYALAIRALRKAGFEVVREGKHTVMSDGGRILTIPRHNPINAFTMGGIAKDAGLTPEQFRELLWKATERNPPEASIAGARLKFPLSSIRSPWFVVCGS